MIISLLLGVMLLYILISNVEHIHHVVTHKYLSERLKTKCSLITLNERFFSRNKHFKDVKYVISVEGEHTKGEHGDGGAIHG